jgi:hypothetical protein
VAASGTPDATGLKGEPDVSARTREGGRGGGEACKPAIARLPITS